MTGSYKVKKFLKRLVLTIVVLFLGVYIINSETSFFKTLKENNPSVLEDYPIVASLDKFFSGLPTISQIKENLTREEMPLEPEDFAENAYIKNSPLLTFYENESVGITSEDGSFKIFGITTELAHPNLLLEITKADGEVIEEISFGTDTEFKFSKTIKIPETTENRLSLNLFTGEKKYGDYIGWLNDYIHVVKGENGWELEKSPVMEKNKIVYETPRSTSKALRSTEYIQSRNSGIKSVATQLTEGLETDYEKIKVLHDWVCSYLHYDNDSLQKKNIAPYSATEVLKTRKGVCIGYANLYAALCRSIDIPCYVVTGYALGISSGSNEWTNSIIKGKEENHAWNEAYVDGRWVIIDTTWDSFNSIENGEMKKGKSISHLYFDANIDFFSLNHKIISYS